MICKIRKWDLADAADCIEIAKEEVDGCRRQISICS